MLRPLRNEGPPFWIGPGRPVPREGVGLDEVVKLRHQLALAFFDRLTMIGMLALIRRPRFPVTLRIEVQVDFAAYGRGEGREQTVVVALRDGVVLVIVAAGAADGQAQHGGAERGQLVV